MGRIFSAVVTLAVVGAGAWYVTGLARDLKMPTTRDPKLVGYWVGKKGEKPLPRFHEIQFFADGTASVPGMSQIRWGTINGTLHLVGRASGTDWLNGVYDYQIGNKRRSIAFKAKPLGMLPREFIRR